MKIPAMRSSRDVVIVNGSIKFSSCSVYCQSALSLSRIVGTRAVSSSFSTIAYVGSGGTNASLAAMREGSGGQQKMLHSFLIDGQDKPVAIMNQLASSATHHILKLLTMKIYQLSVKCNLFAV